MPGKN
jgi:hypothetical protein